MRDIDYILKPLAEKPPENYLRTCEHARRNIDMHRLRVAGMTYREIASRYGLSTERARHVSEELNRIGRRHPVWFKETFGCDPVTK